MLEQIRQKQLKRDEKKLGDRWRTLREKKRIEALIEAREGATPALPAPPASPTARQSTARTRPLALGRLLAAEGPDAALRAVERGSARAPRDERTLAAGAGNADPTRLLGKRPDI